MSRARDGADGSSAGDRHLALLSAGLCGSVLLCVPPRLFRPPCSLSLKVRKHRVEYALFRRGGWLAESRGPGLCVRASRVFVYAPAGLPRTSLLSPSLGRGIGGWVGLCRSTWLCAIEREGSPQHRRDGSYTRYCSSKEQMYRADDPVFSAGGRRGSVAPGCAEDRDPVSWILFFS